MVWRTKDSYCWCMLGIPEEDSYSEKHTQVPDVTALLNEGTMRGN